MKIILSLCFSLTLSFNIFSQGSSQTPKSFPEEWLKYEYYEHQLFFAHNSLEFFKNEVASAQSDCFVRIYDLKTKASSWQQIKGMNADGFTYDVQEKKGIVQKTILFGDITDWKFSKNGVDYGYFSKQQIISFDSPDTNYKDMLSTIMTNFYDWKFTQGTQGLGISNAPIQKPTFELVYDIENYEISKSKGLEVKTEVHHFPQFPGGIYWMHKYINSKIDFKKYENLDLEPIYVRFTVATDGSLKDIAIVRGEINPAMDEIVAKMVHDMPRWIPAIKDYKAVESVCYLPVYFNY
ncbi:MAG: energy transducer TonB [Bacteroidia bacterium]